MTTPALIPAATLILLYDGENGLETLMVKRNENLRFAGGNWAFAGGKIDEKDYALAQNNELNAAKIAALRETFEEIGLAFDENGEFQEHPKRAINDFHTHIPNSEVNFSKIQPLSRWRPPPEIKLRFDTWFFICKVDKRHQPNVDGDEIVDAKWESVEILIEKYRNGEIKTFFPTIINLHLFSKMRKYENLLKFANWENPPIIQTQSELIGEKYYQFIDSALDYPLYHARNLN